MLWLVCHQSRNLCWLLLNRLSGLDLKVANLLWACGPNRECRSSIMFLQLWLCLNSWVSPDSWLHRCSVFLRFRSLTCLRTWCNCLNCLDRSLSLSKLGGYISVLDPALATFIVWIKGRRASIEMAGAGHSSVSLVFSLNTWSLARLSASDSSIPSKFLRASFILLSESDTAVALRSLNLLAADRRLRAYLPLVIADIY